MQSIYTNKILGRGLTFDDVLVVPSYSSIHPRNVELSTKFSRSILLKAPLVSAAMDTVTEYQLAISIAREGGIGIIHKNMSIEEQARQVKKVKRAENGMIYDPITISPEQSIGDALNLMRENKIGGIPVVNHQRILEGIVTNRDLRFEYDMGKSITEVMTPREKLITISPNKFTTIDEATDILKKHRIEKLPVIDEEKGFLLGLITFKDLAKVKDNPNASKDNMGRLQVAAAIGVTFDSMERAEALYEANVDAIAIDTAHGHSIWVIDLLKKIKQRFSNIDVVVGNVATAEAAIELAKAGADAIKVGIGPGSICTTRVIAGVGVPQLSAIYETSQALKNTPVTVIADGGIRYSGDIVKALVAGADCVMAGSLFAGVEESPGETIIYNGRKFKTYRGMGSVEAMQRGSRDRYFQEIETDMKKLVPEGIAGRVPYKGTLSEVIYQLLGGIKAGMGYCGAAKISDLSETKFVEITSAGVVESHPHDVTVTSEAPNYSRS